MEAEGTEKSLLGRATSKYLFKLTVFVVAVLLVMVSVGGYTIMTAENEIRDTTQENVQRLSNLQANGIEQWRNNLERQTTLISESDSITNRENVNVSRYLATVDNNPTSGLGREVVGVHLVTLPVMGQMGESTILNSSVPELEGTSGQGLPWATPTFESASGRIVDVTEPYDSPASENETIAIVSPTGGAEGSSQAIVVVVDTGLAAKYRLEAPSEDGDTFVVDGDGTVVLSTHQDHVGESVTSLGSGTSSLVGGKVEGAQYLSDVSLDGTAQATGAAGVRDFDWTVAASQPKSSAFALAGSIRTLIVVLLGVAVFSFVAFFLVIGRGAIADVQELSKKAATVAEKRGQEVVELETDRNDEIGRLYGSVDEMQRSLNDQIEDLQDLNDRMEDAVDHQSSVMDGCADGDLSRRMDTNSGVDQLDSLAADFNGMMDDLQASIEEALSFSYTVASASEEAAAAAGESKEASRRVSEGTQEISHGTDRQSEELATIVEEMSSFSASIEEVASSANQLSTRSTDAADTAQQGRAAAQQAVEQLQTIEAETQEAVTSFQALREEAQAIEEIVDFISQVAEQTNMLALNANIEASRAADAGGSGGEEGFGVVAEEIKELATDTQDAASDVEERLTAIQERTEETSSNIDDAQASIQQGTETIQEALEALDGIAEAVEDVDVSVQEIDDVVESQSETAQQVVTRVEEVSDIAERNARQAEDVAAAAEEQTVTVDEISSTVDELSDQADQLADLLDRFTVETPADTESATLD